MLNNLIMTAIQSALPSKLKNVFNQAMQEQGKFTQDINGVKNAMQQYGVTASQIPMMLQKLNSPLASGMINRFAPGFLDFVNDTARNMTNENAVQEPKKQNTTQTLQERLNRLR